MINSLKKSLQYAGFMLSFWLESLFRPGQRHKRAEELAQQQPVIVLGRGKSGTRLLPKCLAQLGVAMVSRKEVAAADIDDWVFRKVVKRLAQRNLFVDSAEDISARDLALFQKVVWRLWQNMKRNPDHVNAWGWKFPETYMITPLVLKTFPQARFIHIVRDGRDIAFRNHLTEDPGTRLGHALMAHMQALDKPHHIRAALSWKFQVEKYARFAQQIPAQNHFEMRFEHLCAEPVDVVSNMASFLNRPMTDACVGFVKEHIRQGNISQYKQEQLQQIEEVEALIGETLQQFGYSTQTTTKTDKLANA